MHQPHRGENLREFTQGSKANTHIASLLILYTKRLSQKKLENDGWNWRVTSCSEIQGSHIIIVINGYLIIMFGKAEMWHEDVSWSAKLMT